MRQAEKALKSDDLDELADIALDLSAAASALNQYLADRDIYL
jgi:hypothetical protein